MMRVFKVLILRDGIESVTLMADEFHVNPDFVLFCNEGKDNVQPYRQVAAFNTREIVGLFECRGGGIETLKQVRQGASAAGSLRSEVAHSTQDSIAEGSGDPSLREDDSRLYGKEKER